RLSGLITGVDRRMTKQGNAWAIVNLADRDGQIEVLFFPAAYQLVMGALVEDSVVTVQGRINERDGAINIAGQEIQVLDVSSAERSGVPPVQLFLPYHRVNEPTVKEMKRILGAHPGDNPVHLSVRGPQTTTVFALGYTVNAGTIASDIKGSFGQEAWQGV